MNATARDWNQANHALLVAELAALRLRLEPLQADKPEAGADDAEAIDKPERRRLDALAAMPGAAAIDVVSDVFGLTPFERQVLLLCCGVEFDGQLAAACARRHGADGQHYVTFGMALQSLPEPHWSALTPSRPLRRWRLLEVDSTTRLVDSPLRVDERILHFVAGINQLDARLRPLLTVPPAPRLMAGNQAALTQRLQQRMRSDPAACGAIQFDGNDAHGQQDIAATIAAQLGWRLYVLRGEDLPNSSVELDLLRTLWEREARLLPALLLVQAADKASACALSAFVEPMQATVLISSREPLRLRRPVSGHTVDKPDPGEQKQLWQQALGERGARLNGTLDTLAGQFRLSAQTIAGIADSTDDAGLANPLGADDRNAFGGGALLRACRRHGRECLDDLAERLNPIATWDDLVLPPQQHHLLRQIAAQLRQRIRVYEEWGFARYGALGTGVSALFYGESGTGKTLAAQSLANELGLDLYRIDLSAVVSKYIGETEKNLRRVFDAAEDSGAILLFDEADALFGKRSEVKDSHDRYANIEVSYLLQRMEAYRGLAVLTTNMKTALDRAFQRRLRFVINFPFPDSALRETIWRRAFPPQAPLDDIDYRKLARLSLPGGNIRNIALNAAFLAAEAGESMAMSHLLSAAQGESAKLERPLSDAETRGWT